MRSVERRDADAGELEVNRRDVREADDPLGSSRKALPVDLVHEARSPIAASRGDDGPYPRIEESQLELVLPPRVVPGEIAGAREHRPIEEHLVALAEERESAKTEDGFEGTRGCDDGDRVPRTNRSGDDHFRCCGSSSSMISASSTSCIDSSELSPTACAGCEWSTAGSWCGAAAG